MERFFNTEGPCEPSRHYMLPPLARLPTIQRLIDRGKYLVLHAPRQSGKTTALRALVHDLNHKGRYLAAVVTMEVGAPFTDDISQAERLDQERPSERIKERLDAQEKTHFQDQRRFMSDLKEPEFYLPDDPLGMIVSFLGDEAAARWLYLGAVFVRPVLAFPEGSFEHREVDLVKRLKDYGNSLEEWIPGAQRQIELSQKLHQEGCSGMLALFARHRPDPEDVELGLRIIKSFRDATARGSTRVLHEIQCAGVLNLLGSEALWQGDLQTANQAYGRAQELALVDRDVLTEWVAATGLALSLNWQGDHWGVSRAEREPILAAADKRSRRRDELEKGPKVQEVKQHHENVVAEAQKRLLGRLCEDLANDRESEHPAFGVSGEKLQELLQDQEELGLPPMGRGEVAQILGTIWLLLAPSPEEKLLSSAVALLCRYGTGGLGGTFKKFRFYSPALHPLRPDFSEVCQEVLRPGRSPGEWLAKLAFLERHALDLPLSLATRAREFYDGSLKYFLQQAAHNRWIIRQEGPEFGSTADWSILGSLIEQAVLLAGLLPDGIDWVHQLLQRSEPSCWLRVLECLRIVRWGQRWDIGELPTNRLAAIAERLVELLESPESEALFAEERLNGTFVSDDFIPSGIAQILSVLQKLAVEPALVSTLHGRLCQMLEAGLRRDKTPLYQRTFFSTQVFAWLHAQADAETRSLVERQVDALLDRIDSFATDSGYFARYQFLSRVLPQLSTAQVDRLERLLKHHREELLRAAATREYAAASLAWFAARAMATERPGLHDVARDLVACTAPVPAVLAAIVTAPPPRLGELFSVLDRAVLHCLRGLVSAPMPWFHADRLPPSFYQRDALVSAGLDAVHNYIHEHGAHPPPSGWASWLDPVLAHIYSRDPDRAASALKVLNLALGKIPTEVDRVRAIHALTWALAQPDRPVRDAGLAAALRHRSYLEAGPAGVALAEALRNYDPPKTVSARWFARTSLLAEEE